jgi:hypothetical protein
MSTDIQINYVNKSYHRGHPTIIVFTKPVISPNASQPTVWQAIKNIGYNCWHKFTYTVATSVQVSWNKDNQQETLTVDNVIGKNYSFEKTQSSYSLVETGSNQEAHQFEIINNVSTLKEISVIAYKDGNRIQIKERVASNQKVVFVFHSKLYFGISSSYEVGDVINPEMISQGFTEISLQGLHSCDVILKGDAENGYIFERAREVLALRG